MSKLIEWVVYILKCGDGTLYTGITKDINRRIYQHSIGKGAKYTRGRGELVVVYIEPRVNRSAALKRESEIKALSRFSKLQLCKINGNVS